MNIDRLPDQWREGGLGAHLAALVADPSLLESVEQEQLIELLARVDSLRACIWVRLIAPALQPAAESASVDNDRLLTVPELAVRLAVDPAWIYRHKDKLPFTRRLSSGTLRFCERGLRKWLDTRK